MYNWITCKSIKGILANLRRRNMRTILSWRRYGFVARVATFLVAAVLVVGMAGCTGSVVVKYDLTIASTGGGHVTSPGEGTFSYNEGTVVTLVAEAEQGYQFINWTGDVGTIGNVNAPETIITTNDDYDITANFAPCMVAAGYYHTVGLKTDGTVVAVGD
jgi:uncharacterized repeat protein (TIGR02543 family)